MTATTITTDVSDLFLLAATSFKNGAIRLNGRTFDFLGANYKQEDPKSGAVLVLMAPPFEDPQGRSMLYTTQPRDHKERERQTAFVLSVPGATLFDLKELAFKIREETGIRVVVKHEGTAYMVTYGDELPKATEWLQRLEKANQDWEKPSKIGMATAEEAAVASAKVSGAIRVAANTTGYVPRLLAPA